jgi:hypothetical protein
MNSGGFDFNLENYSIEDIYRLFDLDISHRLGIEELKKAKQIMLMMHPDKSKLPKEYFIFFNKAYSVLVKITQCNQTNRKHTPGDTYSIDEYYNAELHHYITTNKNEIQSTFNSRFEKINADLLPDVQNGYGSWLRGTNDESSTISLEDHHKVFTNYKEKHNYNPTDNAVTILTPDIVQGGIGYSMLVDDSIEYSSGLFNSLQYTDLKKSYTNTLFDISSDTFNIGDKPQTMEQISKIRQVTVPPIFIGDSKSILKEKENIENDISTHREYVLCKQLEQSQLKNNLMTCEFFKIIN